jgi:hypothetical protein
MVQIRNVPDETHRTLWTCRVRPVEVATMEALSPVVLVRRAYGPSRDGQGPGGELSNGTKCLPLELTWLTFGMVPFDESALASVWTVIELVESLR